MQSPATTVARTKYRVPRPRADAVARGALLARVRAAVLANPLTAIVAPAGYGKTTLLAQLAASLDGVPLAWISIDEDDDDPNRVFASLVHAVEPFGLEFEEEPGALIANAAGSGTQSRAAVGALVNALCTSASPRLVIVVDDLHRVAHPDVGTLLEALVERLPDHVSLVLAGRSLPALPLARWVVRGEAEEFGPRELGFDAAEAGALAAVRGRPAGAAEIERLLERTHGWAAGLAMLLRAPRHGAGAPDDTDAQLFDYLAAEVLDELPPELRRFVLDCAVLAELTPAVCAVVGERADAARLLRALYAQDLFVTALDATGTVLRYHDLFRDFLLARLHDDPSRLRELHRRAARAEASATRAIHHWIAAGDWTAALQRLAEASDTLLAEGGHAAVARWLDRFPAPVVEREPMWHYLRGLCAWRRWDWFRSRDALARAAELQDGSTDATVRARTLIYLMGSRSGLGDREGARAAAEQVRSMALDDAERATLALQDAWYAMGAGDGPGAVTQLRMAARLIARDPQRIAPVAADRAQTIYIGLPGAQQAYRELLAALCAARGAALAPWHGTIAEIEGWVALWHGNRERTESAIASAHAIIGHFGDIPPLQDGLARLEAVHFAITGRGAAGLAVAQPLVTRFEAPQAASLRVAFESAYVHGAARVAWAAAEHTAFRALAERAARPPRPEEWRFVGMAARAIPAQLALLDRDWERAAEAFEQLVPEHATGRCPMGQADPRIGLAHARLQQGRRAEAVAALDALLDECLAEGTIGPLLLEPDWLVAPLLDALPAQRRGDPRLAPLLGRLGAWRESVRPAAAAPTARAVGVLGRLSDREREVLERVAGGASNKEIARDLDLSLHTVKRHIANILGKLDCVSRRQAADLVRREARRA